MRRFFSYYTFLLTGDGVFVVAEAFCTSVLSCPYSGIEGCNFLRFLLGVIIVLFHSFIHSHPSSFLGPQRRLHIFFQYFIYIILSSGANLRPYLWPTAHIYTHTCPHLTNPHLLDNYTNHKTHTIIHHNYAGNCCS